MPLVIVTVVPAIEHAPDAEIAALLLALVVATTVNVLWYAAVAGAPVKLTVGAA